MIESGFFQTIQIVDVILSAMFDECVR